MEDIERVIGYTYHEINQFFVQVGINLLIAILIFAIGFWLAKLISRTLKRLLIKSNIDTGLVTFLSSLTSILLKILVIITGITELGVEMTSFLTILGATGLAIGMAFSGTLSNFAGGIMMLIFKPFKVGDLIEAQGVTGVVKEILIFNTFLTTFDNKIIVLPNGPLANGNIINYTRAEKRRVDFTFSIAYGDDLKLAKDTLQKFIKENKLILKDPEPFVGLGQLADSSINIVVKVWTKTDDYWPVFYALNERVYNEFPEVGLNFPFPQLDIHMKQSV